jgi:hypothetical protein
MILGILDRAYRVAIQAMAIQATGALEVDRQVFYP